MTYRLLLLGLITVLLAGCVGSRTPGGYYSGDGPHPASGGIDPSTIPDAIPRNEPVRESSSRPYTVFGRKYYPLKSARGYSARGTASWYGRKFHGQRTASGEVYDMHAMTAAHTTLPLPSYVRVTNSANGRSVIVRVNDRGPFLHNRVIDLSYVAAAKLGMLENGTAEVEVVAVFPGDTVSPVVIQGTNDGAGATQSEELPPDQPPVADDPSTTDDPVTQGYQAQVGAFTDRRNAERLHARLERGGLRSVHISRFVHRGTVYYRVRIGPYARLSALQDALDRLHDLGLRDAKPVKH